MRYISHPTTTNFKAKTTMKEVKNPTLTDIRTVGIDVGYSAVKVYAQNKVYSFPAFVKESPAGTTYDVVRCILKLRLSIVSLLDASAPFFQPFLRL